MTHQILITSYLMRHLLDLEMSYNCPTCAIQFKSVEDLCTHLTDDPQCNGVPVPLSVHQPAGPGEERTARYHENSGSIYAFNAHHIHNMYYPFADREEWELAKFLSENLNQGQITRFLKLLWVKSTTQKAPAYTSAQQMFTFIDALPRGPKWRCMTIKTEGYITTHPVQLIWRDALEVMQHISGNPVFANDMEFDPYEIHVNGEREYGEWMSSQRTHDIQDQLPPGATIVPIIPASDKTPVTHQTGALEMHPMFLTTANIHSDIRMKATTHTWSCMAYMPILQFVCHPDFLQACVWHQCADIVCENLKITATTGTSMVDSSGHACYTFTPLVAYTTDLPEQQMIACITLHQLCQHVDPWKVQQFQEEAKVCYLSGVQLPFWHNWHFSDPAFFLAPDILHTLHKMFFEHIFEWCKEVLGADELNSRFHSQHKCIGTQHFSQGVSHVQQMTRWEHWDIQRTIVTTIAGVADADFIQAICALVDFIYQAQSPTFTPSSINAMTSLLAEFHHFKGAIINAEARRGTSSPIEHFKIPKLELFASFARAIPNLGAPIQFTYETSERMLITHSSRSKSSAFWIGKIQHAFDLYALLQSKTLSLNNLIDNEFEEVIDIDLTFSWIACIVPEDVSHFHGPHPICNHFLKGLLSEDNTVTFHVTVSSDLADKSSNLLVQLYHLPNFPNQLRSFIEHVNGPGSHFQTHLLKVWNKFHLQLHLDLRPHLVMPSQQVQAYPLSETFPFRNCDIVLLQSQNDTRGSVLPPELAAPLLYMQLFEVISHPQDDPAVMIPNGTRTRLGTIVSLTDVTHTIELIPEYSERVNRNVTSMTSLELYDTFYLNSFSDKEWYHSLHADFC
ncbi:hypothetical protein BDR07DRAFT_1453684 [Suillus spraguei]|nr:hypothetical protein BDR07DRAFT_1453684 [Suillus spraguei]